MTEERKAVEMTDEELKQFEAFKEEQAARKAKEQAKRDREAYKELVDETIEGRSHCSMTSARGSRKRNWRY